MISRPVPERPYAGDTQGGVVLADRRGLAAGGVVLVQVVCAAAGALFDMSTRGSLQLGFAVAFSLGAFLATLCAHREDLFASVVTAPLVFLGTVVGVNLLERQDATRSFITSQLLDLAVSLITKAPTLFAGFAAAAVVAIVRAMGRAPSPRQPPRHPAGHRAHRTAPDRWR